MISVVSRSIQQSDRSGFSEHPTVLGISVVMAAEASLPSCGRADIAAISAIALVSCAGVNQKASALTILSQNSNSDPNKRQERRVSLHLFSQFCLMFRLFPFFSFVLSSYELRTAMDEDEVYGFWVILLLIVHYWAFGILGRKWHAFRLWKIGKEHSLLLVIMSQLVAELHSKLAEMEQAHPVVTYLDRLLVVGKDRCFYLSENLDEKDDNTFWIQKDDREYPYELGHGLSEGAGYSSGGPVNLYNDQHLCLNFGMNFEGNKEQCINPEGFARFLGLLESVPFNDTFSNEQATADSRCFSLLNFNPFCCIMQSMGANKLFLDKCKAAYFIVVLHHLKTVVIAVRGTETPEDLKTDGLCRECSLSEGDLA
nr:probable protein phosphatase 2C 51 [Ipomoea batatas]